jgi:DNA-binding FadR family transcriptional regulator
VVPSRAIRVPALLTGGGGGLADSVARLIADAVHLGLVQPGEQLPSEGVLANHLGVSIMTLREALATLREQGLVETRRGRNGGSFILAPGSPSVARLEGRLRQLSATDLRDLGDERLAVLGTSTQLAARRASDVNVEKLRSLAGDLRVAATIGERARAYSRFWIEVALATQSERLTHATVRLQALVGELLWLPGVLHEQQGDAAAELGQVADAVEGERELVARRLAETMLDQSTRRLIGAHLALTRRVP